MRTPLIPICFVLAMPFCCGLAKQGPETSIKTAYTIASTVPPGVEDLTPIKTDPVPAVAAAQCIVDDGEPDNGCDQPLICGPKDLLQLPQEDDANQPKAKPAPGAKPKAKPAPDAKPKPTPPSPSPSSSAPSADPTLADTATICETRMSDSCETFCEARGKEWDSTAGNDGTCYRSRPNHKPAVLCGCMCKEPD
jgi:hypothetical protein